MASKYSPQNLNDVSGLVAVVTGGGAGLGLIITQALEANGATVYITGRRQEVLDAAVKGAQHGNIKALQGSTTSHEDVQKAVDVITKETGHIDLLVLNAGISSADKSENPRPKPTGESSISEIRDYYWNYRPASIFTDVLETNVAAAFTTTMAFLELLDAGNKRREKSKPTSQVIAIGSVGGLIKFTDSFIYNASKAAVHHLMQNLGNFLVPHSIRTNVVAPGWFPTDMTVPVQKMFQETQGVMPKTLVPQERMGSHEEFAGTILYLASKAGGYCNGNMMVIDGGVRQNHA